MHGLKTSLSKRLYSLLASPRAARQTWGGAYWSEADGFRDVACRGCPKFDASKPACRVPFGTPLRQCVVAAIEAHLHDARGLDVLELGFGRFALARNLIRRSGGTWTGVEPKLDRSLPARIGRGCYGHAAEIPFPDATFDLVFGIQSFEHWGQRASAVREPSSYHDCLREVRRVLKPGGAVYLDAPIHFHGNEMFIVGDLPKIRGLFGADAWSDVTIERWRLDHAPLAAYPPSAKVQEEWPLEIVSYPAEAIEAARRGTVWLMTLTARKKGA